jgi:hypothetical protein
LITPIYQPGFGQHAGPDERLHCGLDRQVDSATGQGGELTHHGRNAWQSRARAGQEIDQQVEIAVRPHLAPAAEQTRNNSLTSWRRQMSAVAVSGNSIPAAMVMQSMRRSIQPSFGRTEVLILAGTSGT